MLRFPGKSLTAAAGLGALSLMLALVVACGGAAETPAPATGQTSASQSAARPRRGDASPGARIPIIRAGSHGGSGGSRGDGAYGNSASCRSDD